MGVERNDNGVPVFEVVAHILDLICVNVRRGELNRNRKVYYCLSVGRRLPNVKHRIANLKRIFGLCSRKGFGRILIAVIYAHFLCDIFKENCTVNGDFQYLFL